MVPSWYVKPILTLAGENSDIAGHLMTLFSLAMTHLSVVELGVRDGNSTVALLAGGATRAPMGEASYLTSVDIDPTCPERVRATMARIFGPVPHLETWRRWQFAARNSVNAAEDWPDAWINLLFIDTSHELEQTRHELKAWLPKMTRDCTICGHDYCLDGAGVKQAVDEFHADHPEFRLVVHPWSYGLFILTRGQS